jgi:hypothetical protein
MGDVLKFLQQVITQPDHGIVIALIALVLLILLLFKDMSNGAKIGGGIFLAAVFVVGIVLHLREGESDGPVHTLHLHGYFVDLKTGSQQFINTSEILELELSANYVKGHSTGEVFSGGNKQKKQWEYRGIHKDGTLSLGFRTLRTEDDQAAKGRGVIFLDETGGGSYEGVALYYDCEHHAIEQCPYALSPKELDEAGAKKQWPLLFANSCTTVNLTPDYSPASEGNKVASASCG